MPAPMTGLEFLLTILLMLAIAASGLVIWAMRRRIQSLEQSRSGDDE